MGEVYRAVEGDPLQSPTVSLAATRAGMIFGPAAYMAPEQAQGPGGVDRRTDVWAFRGRQLNQKGRVNAERHGPSPPADHPWGLAQPERSIGLANQLGSGSINLLSPLLELLVDRFGYIYRNRLQTCPLPVW
jgi:serine/threonine protein kinase